MKRQKCPCCGYYTFINGLGGTYDICPVCFWEDDITDYSNPEACTGANHVNSLIEARENFQKYGVCEPEMKRYVRPPRQSEKCD